MMDEYANFAQTIRQRHRSKRSKRIGAGRHRPRFQRRDALFLVDTKSDGAGSVELDKSKSLDCIDSFMY